MNKIYIAFNKPYLVLSQFKELDDKETLKKYIQLKERPKAVGRLDYDSEGLLFLSNDEEFIYFVTHPRSKTEKEYLVQVEGIPTEDSIRKLQAGMTVGKEYYKPAKAKIIEPPPFLWERTPPIRFRKSIPTSWISLTIIEGKNRQVRKMTAHVGLPTLRLIRYRIGNVTLDNILVGEYKKLLNVKNDFIF